jgi:hypothetical protein
MKKSKWQEFKSLFEWGHPAEWYFRNFINLVDDPIDAAKEWLHCHSLPFGYQLNIAFMMRNRGRPYWPVIRKRGNYGNCDPEDLSQVQKSD